jgi:CRP/FNR family cyclic AMP-dependent transcriptional regulator
MPSSSWQEVLGDRQTANSSHYPGPIMRASFSTIAARPSSPKWNIAIAGLDDNRKQAILDKMRPLSFDPKALLFAQDEPSDTLILLVEGRVRLFQAFESGAEFTFGIYLPGTLLGLAALVAERPRILSAEAVDPVRALSITRIQFLACLKADAVLHWNITRLLAMLSIDSIGRGAPMALDSASVRLGMTIQSLAHPDESDPAGKRHCVAGQTQEDLAKMIGVSRSWVGIALADLETEGLISKRRGRITIADMAKLENFIKTERSPG